MKLNGIGKLVPFFCFVGGLLPALCVLAMTI